jgi:HAD superfamily hydrolase (TIGR01509 family)
MNIKRPLSFAQVPRLSILKAGFPGLKALFFDMDGTLFDTEKYHAEALMDLGRDHQIKAPISPDEIHALMIGKADYLLFELIKDWPGFPRSWSVEEFVADKNLRLLEILGRTQRDAFMNPNIPILLEEARTEGLFIGLVTSSERLVTKELIKTAGLESFFDLELTRDDCPLHKPHPWPYLEALRISGREPIEAMIFEDSNVGLTSALASGCHVIKVEWY